MQVPCILQDSKISPFLKMFSTLLKTDVNILGYLFCNFTNILTLSQTTNFRLFDDNFKFDRNGRKLSKWVKYTERKGEIAHHEQFLLIPQYFQSFVLQTRKNRACLGKS